MSIVARCDLVAEPLPAQPMTFGPGGSGDSGQLAGWTEHPLLPGIGIGASDGVLAWTLPDELTDRPLQIDIEASGIPIVTVNGRSRPVARVGDDSHRLHVPRAIATAYGKGRVVLVFARSDLRLLSMRVHAAG